MYSLLSWLLVVIDFFCLGSVADILTANSKNSAHRFLHFMARYVILPLSRRLLSVFLPTTSASATFVVCRVREDKYAQSFMTLTQIVQIKFRVRISLSCKKNFVLCLVEFSNQGKIQDSNNFLTDTGSSVATPILGEFLIQKNPGTLPANFAYSRHFKKATSRF